jgi:SseB protein N-terminal domain
VRAALDAYAAGRGSEHAALTALAASRLLVPVVALLTAGEPAGQDGPRREKASEMALPTLIGADGRAALPAFTCLDSLIRWRADARPVPVPAAGVWQSAVQLAAKGPVTESRGPFGHRGVQGGRPPELAGASAVVIDVAGPVPFAVDGARLAALASGGPVPLPHEDPDVMALAHGVLAAEPAIAGFRLLPGGHGTDLTLCLVPGPAATQAQVRDAVERVSTSIMAGAEGRVRRGIEVALTGAGLTGASGEAVPGAAAGDAGGMA